LSVLSNLRALVLHTAAVAVATVAASAAHGLHGGEGDSEEAVCYKPRGHGLVGLPLERNTSALSFTAGTIFHFRFRPDQVLQGRLFKTQFRTGQGNEIRAVTFSVIFSWRGCFCSPLKRAKETAEIICGAIDLPFTIKTELAEIDLGEWDGRKKTEIASAYPEKLRERQEDLLYFRHPCGESFAELEARVIPFLVPLLQEKGKWLVVSHAGVYRVLIHALFGVPFPMTFGYDLGYGQIRMFCRTGDYLFVKGFDELMVHLEELK